VAVPELVALHCELIEDGPAGLISASWNRAT
jgi:hypothetical protein